MTYASKMLTALSFCIVLVICGLSLRAQSTFVQNAIDKLDGYKNFSFQSALKQKDGDSDTITVQGNDFFSNAPGDKVFGYLFRREMLINDKFSSIDLYDGNALIRENPADSTYIVKEINLSAIGGSLPERLTWLNVFLKKNPSKIVQLTDTIINAVTCYHLVVNTYDTIIDKEHYRTNLHLIIDKASGLPSYIITKSGNTGAGDRVKNYYSELRFFNYKFNQDVDIDSITGPTGFQLRKERPAPPLLTMGSFAPDWTLYAADGKKISLSQMKGKVILLDFYFIGCYPCMQSIKPLNKLYEKYKNQSFVITSLTERDSLRAVLTFEKNNDINYPGYIHAAGVVKAYKVQAFPTFYFIDKEGKIANVMVGYNDDFEMKATSIINNLISK